MTDTDRYLASILNTINDGLVVVGPDGRIVLVNPAMTRLTGYEEEELLGKDCSVLNCDVCQRSRKEGRQHWCRLFDKQVEHRRHCTIIRKDGTCVPVLKNAKLLMEEGEVVAAVETLTDVTELMERDRRIEELSREVQKVHEVDGAAFAGMVGDSPAMQRVYHIIERAAASDAPVLILGESGTGKELAARAIHELGRRKDGPYVQLNCAALNESILESELLGHVKGAFTGAVRHRVGRFEAAHGGDIFLDEIGDAPLSIQVKLLRVLETKRIERVGDNQPIHVDVRIITATNKDLASLVARGEFREDFLYRINTIPIHIPPLRERKEDIPALAAHFLARMVREGAPARPALHRETLRVLMAYGWPGNVRELRSALEYALVLADGPEILPEHLPAQIGDPDCAQPGAHTPPPMTTPARPLAVRASSRAEKEREELVAALRETGGNQSEAARLLGLHRGTVANRMRKYAIDVTKVIGV